MIAKLGMNLDQYCAKPRKLRSSDWFFSLGACASAPTLSLDTCNPLSVNTFPRYSMLLTSISGTRHSSVLNNSLLISSSLDSAFHHAVLLKHRTDIIVNIVCTRAIFEDLPDDVLKFLSGHMSHHHLVFPQQQGD